MIGNPAEVEATAARRADATTMASMTDPDPRAAFAAMTKDEAFLADAKRSRIDIEPVSGAEIDSLVREIFAAPKEEIEQVKALVAPGGK